MRSERVARGTQSGLQFLGLSAGCLSGSALSASFFVCTYHGRGLPNPLNMAIAVCGDHTTLGSARQGYRIEAAIKGTRLKMTVLLYGTFQSRRLQTWHSFGLQPDVGSPPDAMTDASGASREAHWGRPQSFTY